MELIDKRKLVEHCFEVVCKLDKQGDNIAADALKKHILWYLVDVESIDAVPVVRCKDCKHRGTDYCIFHINGEPADEELLRKLDNDFCSYGEKRNEA